MGSMESGIKMAVFTLSSSSSWSERGSCMSEMDSLYWWDLRGGSGSSSSSMSERGAVEIVKRSSAMAIESR